MNEPGKDLRLPSGLSPGPAGRPDAGPDRCRCADDAAAAIRRRRVVFDTTPQDTDSPGWRRLLTLVDMAAADGREVFQPFTEMSFDERLQVVTLPPTIAKLTRVRKLVLYNTRLVRLPPEIGAMSSLEEFWPYQSHQLRWYPYEITRCLQLRDSCVSTRVLYGNFKNHSPFPHLAQITTVDRLDRLDPAVRGTDTIRSCSVCDGPVSRELHQVWISLLVATDVLPLLVNACSAECVASLPKPASGYFRFYCRSRG